MRGGRWLGALGASAALLCVALLATPAAAQKKGGTLKLYHNDNPPSTSLHEESTIASVMPFASVFNNLVVFDPARVHESLETVVPELAESWSWDPTNTKLSFKLRAGVKWHDGQPFTAKDVQCTWRMLIGKGDTQDFHRNPRKVWYSKLQDVTINGDYEATFELSEPQPSLPVLLASAFSPVYPCHVPQAVMRTRPIGTGPFKLVDFKRGDSIRLVRNPDYWKKDRPYLDEITFRVIDSRATRMLAFSTGDFDITFPSDVTVTLMRDIKTRAPDAICEMTNSGTQINLMVNRVNPPFDNPDIRKAMSIAIDRKPFNTILMEGQGLLGGAMLPKPVGEWGMPPDMVSQLTGYGPDSEKNIAQAQARRSTSRASWMFSTPRDGMRGSRKRTTRSGSTSPAFPSTIPTAISSRTIPATPSATIPSTATPTSTDCSRRNRANWTGRSGPKSSGRSSVSSSTMPRVRASCSARSAIAGSLT